MLKKLTSVALFSSIITFVGCETMPNNQQSTQNLERLQNRTWIATQIGNTEIKTAPTARNIPSLQFDSASLRVSGADGCNRIMGSYQALGDTLTLSQMAGTKMACLDNGNINQAFNTALNKVTHYQVYAKTLKLLDNHGNLLIQFETAVQPR